MADIANDETVGFQLVTTDDIDDLGVQEIVRRIRQRVGDTPVYLRYCIRLLPTHRSIPNDDPALT